MKNLGTQGDTTEVTEKLAEDNLYQTLAKRPRRRILAYLFEASESTVEELVRVIAGWRAGESTTMVDPEEHERIHIELYHQHIPYLDQQGFVEFEQDNNIVRICEFEPEIQTLVRRSVEAEAQLDE